MRFLECMCPLGAAVQKAHYVRSIGKTETEIYFGH